MPNYCENQATFTHTDPKQIQRIIEAYNNNKLFDEFVPCHPDLLRESENKQQEKSIKKENINKYGYGDWYEWRINNWGTKWDVGCQDDNDITYDPSNPNEVILYFNSAWSPPISFYNKLTEDFGFEVKAYFLEEGAAFVGKYTNENMEEIFDLDRESLPDIPDDIKNKWDLESIISIQEDDSE